MKKFYLFLFCTLIICSSCCNRTKKMAINVMTYNIRYDNPDDSLNNWKYRKDRVAKAIKFYQCDIVGSQEVLHNQLIDLRKRLPDYGVIGVGRDDGKEKGEYSALWYKKSRFELLKSGYFWLSQTPDVAGSLGWDAACVRIATWAKLKDKESGKVFIALNTHLDHMGKEARKNGVKLIQEKIHKISNGLPFLITGDFNATPNDVPIKVMLQDSLDKIINTRNISPVVYGPAWSFHDFGKLPFDKRPLIDYIFISKDFSVSRWGVLAETENNQYLSDHSPVLTTLILK